MPDFAMPFPGRELADKELSYDYCYGKIPEKDRASIVQAAWDKGAAAARSLFEEAGGETDFFAIAASRGLECKHVDKDYVLGNQRYFSDYLSGRKRIRLFTKSIALWAKQNQLSQKAAENLILSHEFFHFLECSQIGLTSRDYQVPMLILGSLRLGRTGIRALSEIGAHAFAHTYWDLRKEQPNENS